jgi:uncharacterized alpha-E superfamily protein
MLSRTADHLYWMSRYLERAENLARMLDARHRRSLLPGSAAEEHKSCQRLLGSLGLAEAYTARHGELDAVRLFDFLATDRASGHSIASCLRAARENARAVRGTITADMWETINSTWLQTRELGTAGSRRDHGEFIDWVKYRAHLIRGVTVGTFLRDEAFHFTRIGIYLERADQLTRMLSSYWDEDGTPAETTDWAVLLRAQSAFEIYRRVFRDSVTPRRAVELFVFREDLPRSLLRCLAEVVHSLAAVRNDQSATVERQAGRLHAALRFGSMAEWPDTDIRRILDEYSAAFHALGSAVASTFLVASDELPG